MGHLRIVLDVDNMSVNDLANVHSKLQGLKNSISNLKIRTFSFSDWDNEIK